MQHPSDHVFHIVTDRLNYAPMRMWFLSNPPGKATIEVQNTGEFTWLNDSYSPVLKQLGSQSMIDYYFGTNRANPDSNLKYRNSKYLSILNHLRFYLPEIYPKLDKMVFLDDDIVVKKDLTGLWSINMKGKVNGAVETIVTEFGVDAAIRDPGSSSQFAGRGRQGSMSLFRMGRHPVCAGSQMGRDADEEGRLTRRRSRVVRRAGRRPPPSRAPAIGLHRAHAGRHRLLPRRPPAAVLRRTHRPPASTARCPPAAVLRPVRALASPSAGEERSGVGREEIGRLRLGAHQGKG